MSAATVWEAPAAPLSPSAPAGRPRLHLVPTGPDAVHRSRLRITRRGRLAITTAVAVALVVLGLAVAARAAAAPSVEEHRVLVPAGSTLSDIAARELPGESVAQAVADLRRVNGLASDEVAAGRELVVPAH